MEALRYKKLIDAIVSRPAMYFRPRAGYLRELAATDFGVTVAGDWDGKGSRSSLIPADFVTLVCEKFPTSNPGSVSWNSRIEDHAESEKEAWEIFCDLWHAYRQSERLTDAKTPEREHDENSNIPVQPSDRVEPISGHFL